MDWSIQELRQLRGFAIEWADQDGYLLSRRATLYRTSALVAPQPEHELLRFPQGVGEWLMCRIRLGQRLVRGLFYNVVRLPSGDIFLTFGRRIGVFRKGRVVPVAGLRRGFRVLRGSAAVDLQGNVYFGEYHQNPDRKEVCIYCLPAGTIRAEVAYVFPPGSVRHVHGVFVEPGSNRLWCTTGDRGSENRICVTNDAFRTLTEAGAGDESWRCVALSFGDGEIFFGTDAEFQTNYFYSFDLGSGRRTRIGQADGPVYYAARRGTTHFLATTAEGCPSQQVNAASIWRIEHGRQTQRLATWSKDLWPRALMHGTLHFALGTSDGKQPLFCYLHGLSGWDERTVSLVNEDARCVAS